jgi:predicted nucleotidyltransferase component of viral defense system
LDLEVARRFAGVKALNQFYLDTARLLIQVAPLVFADNIFALKGGTAINLFVRDMPRLSVDLDLAFTDHTVERKEALKTKAAAKKISSISTLCTS